MEYIINKGVGRSVEFKGLRSQYLFICAGGLFVLFVVIAVMYMAGIKPWICIAFGTVSALALIGGTVFMNARYGEWGLMKLQASHSRPYYIINRKRVSGLLPVNQSKA